MDAKKDNMNFEAELESDVDGIDTDMEDPDLVTERHLISSNPLSANIRSIAKKAAIGLFWTLISFLLGSAKLPFGAIPFGIALLSAASGKLAYIYSGLCLSAIFGAQGGLVCFCTYTATVFIRVLCRILIDSPFSDEQSDEEIHTVGELLPLLFSEHIFLRMATSCIGAFVIGIYTLAAGGFLMYDLFGILVSMIAAPICVYLYCGLCANGDALGISLPSPVANVSDNRRFAAICAICASLVLALRDITVVGMSLPLFTSMIITLYYSRSRGIMHALVAGTVCGLACSPMLAPIFAFAAVASGALWRVSTFFACLSACSIGLAWGFYSEGIAALTSVLPALLSASLIFAVVEKLYLADKLKFFSEDDENNVSNTVFEEEKKEHCEILGKDTIDTILLGDTEQKIDVMCDTFSSLSSLFYNLSEKMRTPASADIRQICDNAFDSGCHACELRSTCWESEYSSSLSAVNKLCAALIQNGHISVKDVPKHMLERCSSMPEIINQINRNSMAHTQQLIIGDKTEIFAIDYEAISELLTATMSAQRAQFEYREELSRTARELVIDKGLPVGGVFVYGDDRRKSIVLRGNGKKEFFKKRDEIISVFEECFSERLDCDISESGAQMILSSAKRYSISHAKRSVKAEGEEGFCGDTVSIFESDKERFYSFISDGMGSGREAALTSGICSVFLSNLLKATNKCDLSLTMLNGFLRNKGSGSMHECSATVDLLDLDLVTGKAEFYKGGAAPSYIYRDGNLFKLRSNTVPLGIIKELDTKKISIDVGEGDLIIMVSDGVTQSKEECPWLFDLLKANVGKESLASIADMIVKRAKYEGASDDISVVVMKVESEK